MTSGEVNQIKGGFFTVCIVNKPVRESGSYNWQIKRWVLLFWSLYSNAELNNYDIFKRGLLSIESKQMFDYNINHLLQADE